MKSIVCTLFEGDYHYGVAGLVNSLYSCGYRGDIYAGYRGNIPEWAINANKCSFGIYGEGRVLDIAEGSRLFFVQLNTKYHLTNYKPDFMLNLLEHVINDADAVFYLDPDICVTRKWHFFEDWSSCGVAVCEDINSPLPKNHPRRIGWRRYFKSFAYNLEFRFSEYVNGGFIGLRRENIEFLRLWSRMQEAMAEEIGGLEVAKLTRGKAFSSKGFANCFDASDQDALNAAIEASIFPVSLIGKEAMGFKHGRACALHALGKGKPWQKSYLIGLLRGNSVRNVDKVFWQCVYGPLYPYSVFYVGLKKFALTIASLASRFYKRVS
jgi:hypothetical protein